CCREFFGTYSWPAITTRPRTGVATQPATRCSWTHQGCRASREFPCSGWEGSALIQFGPGSRNGAPDRRLNHFAEGFAPPQGSMNRRLQDSERLSVSGSPHSAQVYKLRYRSIKNSSARDCSRQENRCHECQPG